MKAGLRHAAAIRRLAAVVFILSFPAMAFAAPPYITDDPEPTEYHHWEIYLGSLFTKQTTNWTSTAPHLEANYGALPNVQLELIPQMTFYSPTQGATNYGLGDTQVGIKYRFLQEGDWIPQAAGYPLMLVPTGSHARNLGAGTCKCLCRYGSRIASANGPLMEEAVIGLIRAARTTATRGSAEW